jgi:hypothetical protein
MCPPVDKDAGVLGRQWRVLDAGRKDNRSSTPVAGGHRSQGATEEGLSRRAREQQQQGGAGGRGYRSKFLLNKIKNVWGCRWQGVPVQIPFKQNNSFLPKSFQTKRRTCGGTGISRG